MNPIHVAVVGAGRWGRNLIRNLQASPAFALRAVYDTRPAALAGMSVPCSVDLLSLDDRRDIDAVVIATPPSTHAELVRLCLLNGKHVLCEKPLTLSASSCRELSGLADSRGLCLMVDCTPFYLEEIRAARTQVAWDQVDSIRCLRTSQTAPLRMEELLWDLAPHDLAILHGWLGNLDGEWSVQALGAESVVLEGRCPGKPLFSIELGSSDLPRREITLTGGMPPITYYQRQSQPEPLKVVIEHFAKSIRDGTPPATDAAGALETALILERICNDNLFQRTEQSHACFSIEQWRSDNEQ